MPQADDESGDGSTEGSDLDAWRRRMDPAFRQILDTESPHIERFMHDELRTGGSERFELGLGWLLDGIEASLRSAKKRKR